MAMGSLMAQIWVHYSASGAQSVQAISTATELSMEWIWDCFSALGHD
jgi:hypothetical protein